MSKNPRPVLATYVGLFLALGVPLLIFPLHLLRGSRPVVLASWQGEAVVWGLAALVLAVLVFWEKLPLSTIGLGRPGWSSLAWGVGGAVAARLLPAIAVVAWVKFAHVSDGRAFAQDWQMLSRLGSLPIGVVLLLALRAGVTEEILFRGYGIERLASITRNRFVAAAISLAIFCIAHLGAWDVTYLLFVFPAGLVLTIQYLWRRDLWANICTHTLTDLTGLIGAYAIAHHLIHVSNVPGFH